MHHRPPKRAIPVLLACALLAACADLATAPDPAQEPDLAVAAEEVMNDRAITPERRAWLQALRQETLPLKDFAKAQEVGYTAQLTPCAESEAGGMGYHYGMPSLIDGKITPLDPEVLLYKPTWDGRLKLVAVEYIVPYTMWDGDAPPELLGIPFRPNDVFQVWMLHAWVHSYNPAGTLEDWNPRVSCRYAVEMS